MSYWMIYVRDEGQWSPQFGDKDRDCVRDERVDTYLRQPGYAYPGDGKYSAADIKIVKFPRVPSQGQVNARTAELNNKG